MSQRPFEKRSDQSTQPINALHTKNIPVNPEKHIKINSITPDSSYDNLNVIHEEPAHSKPKKKKKTKKNLQSFKQLKPSESEPVLKWPNKESYRNDFHLPSVKTLHSSTEKKAKINSEKPKKFTLPRLDYSSSEAANNLIEKFESSKSQRLQREKFINMLELFESKLIDVSERSRSVRTKIDKKEKAPKIRADLNKVKH